MLLLQIVKEQLQFMFVYVFFKMFHAQIVGMLTQKSMKRQLNKRKTWMENLLQYNLMQNQDVGGGS